MIKLEFRFLQHCPDAEKDPDIKVLSMHLNCEKKNVADRILTGQIESGSISIGDECVVAIHCDGISGR